MRIKKQEELHVSLKLVIGRGMSGFAAFLGRALANLADRPVTVVTSLQQLEFGGTRLLLSSSLVLSFVLFLARTSTFSVEEDDTNA
jgi:hypothetical protein